MELEDSIGAGQLNQLLTKQQFLSSHSQNLLILTALKNKTKVQNIREKGMVLAYPSKIHLSFH